MYNIWIVLLNHSQDPEKSNRKHEFDGRIKLWSETQTIKWKSRILDTLNYIKKTIVFCVLPYCMGIIYFVVVYVKSHHKTSNEFKRTRNNEICKGERTVTTVMTWSGDNIVIWKWEFRNQMVAFTIRGRYYLSSNNDLVKRSKLI